MSKNMDPSMMAQAQQMMSNPAMAKQAADAMSSMSPSEMKEKLDQSAQLMGNKPAAPPAPAQTVVQKLKASPMSVPAEVIEVRAAPPRPDACTRRFRVFRVFRTHQGLPHQGLPCASPPP
eukprot:2120538-Prymnesium_polylepis.1